MASGSNVVIFEGPSGRAEPPRVLMIFPGFNSNTFWSFRETCRIVGARYPAPPLGLITLAALLPLDWDIRLVNCNTATLTDADIDWCDLVMTGGMVSQQPQTLQVMARCQKRGKPVCVGGPDPTSSPHVYAAADFLVLGEAEGIIDTFVEAWRSGVRTGRFDAEKYQADVTKSPLPRYDLLDMSHYLYMSLQFSRGCPFTCEFCDIIELYGRVPRAKTNEQVFAELERLYELGYRGQVDWVDDNLIGNKKALRRLLPELKKWQGARLYPFKFSTEASINLSDDDELLRMMAECNFFLCFIGIESGDSETLISMQKKQNTRRSIDESIHKMYAAGIFAIAGFIVGFDTERDSMSASMTKLIEKAGIPLCTVGLLTALANTQLTRRLQKEGRLYDGWDVVPADAADASKGGLNFLTLRPRREILEDFRAVIGTIYEPDAFFGRLSVVAKSLRKTGMVRKPSDPIKAEQNMRLLRKLVFKLLLRGPSYAVPFLRLFVWTVRNNPNALDAVVTNTMVYMHVSLYAQNVIEAVTAQLRAIDSGRDPRAQPFVPLEKIAS